jgi:hypothetical protein
MIPYDPDDPKHLVNWFDPCDKTCMKAWIELEQTGMWPDWFWKIMVDNDVVPNQQWPRLLTDKFARCWIDQFNNKK